MNEFGDGGSPLYLFATFLLACAHFTAFCLGIMYGLAQVETTGDTPALDEND